LRKALKNIFSYLIVATIVFSCKNNRDEVLENTSLLFERGEGVGVSPGIIDEASGLAASIVNKGSMWTHNDSKGKPRIFLISDSAKLQAIVTITNVENRDWEDITIGTGPEEGKSYLYIGEIGDNEAKFKTKYVYRLVEPRIEPNGSDVIKLSIADFDRIPIEYPDGKRDVETLLIDHSTSDLYFISKREDSVNVYVARYPQLIDQVNTLTKLGSLPFHNIVAGDLTSHNEILLKNYENVFYWKVKEEESIFSTLTHQPTILPYIPEPQGESITWDLTGNGYFTLSEKNGLKVPELLYYKRSK
jgi:hypothetical protein